MMRDLARSLAMALEARPLSEMTGSERIDLTRVDPKPAEWRKLSHGEQLFLLMCADLEDVSVLVREVDRGLQGRVVDTMRAMADAIEAEL